MGKSVEYGDLAFLGLAGAVAYFVLPKLSQTIESFGSASGSAFTGLGNFETGAGNLLTGGGNLALGFGTGIGSAFSGIGEGFGLSLTGLGNTLSGGGNLLTGGGNFLTGTGNLIYSSESGFANILSSAFSGIANNIDALGTSSYNFASGVANIESSTASILSTLPFFNQASPGTNYGFGGTISGQNIPGPSGVSSVPKSNVIIQSSSSGNSGVVQNQFGGYSPTSGGKVLAQSVPVPTQSQNIVRNQFGGYSPVVNGVVLAQSVVPGGLRR